MNTWINRSTPPGYNVKWEKRFLTACVILSLTISFGFFGKLIYEINKLYYFDGGKRYLRDNAVCANFSDIAGVFFLGFTVTAITSLSFILLRRLYLNQNSKSIYTVKRLPQRLPVFKLTFPVPVSYFLSILFIKYVFILLYFFIYLIAVPKAAFPKSLLDGIWRL